MQQQLASLPTPTAFAWQPLQGAGSRVRAQGTPAGRSFGRPGAETQASQAAGQLTALASLTAAAVGTGAAAHAYCRRAALVRERLQGKLLRRRVVARATATPSASVLERAAVAVSGTAPQLVKRLWQEVGLPQGDAGKEAEWLSAFSPTAVVEDLFSADIPAAESAGVRAYLENKSACGKLVIDRLADGQRSCGFTWHLEEDGVDGLGIRGTTFVELNEEGEICYLREICEPLYKPGDQTVELLKVLGGDNVATFGSSEFARRTPNGASDLCRYLWEEAQGRTPPDEVLQFFAGDIVYEDFNYEDAMNGTTEVGAFLRKFAKIKSLKFVAEKFSDGETACVFTWHVEIAGVPEGAPNIRGVSFYGLNDEGLVDFIRDIPESAIKPPPLQALAANFNPKLRVFQPRPVSTPPCDCSTGGRVAAWPTGKEADAKTILAQVVTSPSGEAKSLGDLVASAAVGSDGGGSAKGAVVVYMRHLG
eukprot:TRINITY_DN37764_c0_g1_i1.p1 TRINITY_DN37764_c0_g1~~TRINITY_DN37764_c0_g1_i1.p1  ORF type:complete len:478 (+),score=142.73 TRINITY_DN37764_c0_g1_i1:113-1546(+)